MTSGAAPARRVITVVGSCFDLDVPNMGVAGYAWTARFDGAAVELVEVLRALPPDRRLARFRFRAVAPGASTVYLVMARPFEAEEADRRAYEIIVSES